MNTPKLAVPFRLNAKGTALEVVEQDSFEEIAACVEMTLATPLGWRLENPDFGLRDQTFGEGGADLHEIQNTISMWEPRADVLLDREPELLRGWVDDVNLIIQRRGALGENA